MTSDLGMLNNSVASESLSKLVLAIVSAISAANNVLIEKQSFGELSAYLERIVPVLKELAKKNISDSESLSNAIENLSQKIKAAKKLAEDCNRKSKVYLLVNCRKIIKRLGVTTKEISRAVSLMPLASFDLSVGIVEEVQKLCDDMLTVEFKAAMVEEEIMEKIESGIQERTVDRSYANKLLTLIAEAVGISTDRTTLKKEFENFKSEIEDTQLRKDQAEAIQMEQIIALLERADATSSPKEKEIKYLNKRNSLGSQPLDPLPSFYCPITKDVMIDPVETSSGQTFERSAIEKWFADGNSLCPLTITPVNPNILRPNKILRQSIEEWADRNTMITITSLKHKILTDEDQGVLYSLGQLQDICEERDSHREWVVLENCIPHLIKLLGAKNREIKKRALVILCMLARDSEDAKKRIVEVDGAICSIVRSLGRRIESKLAVSLLLELSKSDVARNHIGNVQGCILLLVTMSSSDDTESSKDAKDLLENLSFLDQNVILMAKANYFKPLLSRLSSAKPLADAGSEDVKMLMASTLAEMQLSDHGKSALFEDGVLGLLLHLVTDCSPDMKILAAEALRNLSSLPQNGLKMISEGAVRPLLDQLYRHSSSSKLRELVAAIIMNLAISTSAHESGETQLPLLDTDDDIFRLFSLINLTGPDVQLSILETFHAMCEPPSATDIRSKLRQCSAIQVLVQLCQLDTISIRPHALKLFCCLTEDGDDGMLSQHVDQKCIESLLKIIDTSKDNGEVAAILGIISNLPRDHIQITQWLLDAGALPTIFKYLGNGDSNDSVKNQLKENAVGALCRFTVSTNREWQMKVAETGVIPLLVQLLGSGTDLAKRHAAISLSQFSESSYSLSKPIKGSGGFWCFAPPPEIGCPVHMGICSVESSFCLVEADAVKPLVRVLGESDPGACEAALDALLTLINAERLQSGSKVLAETDAIPGIIKLLSSSSVTVQEKALHAIERLFRLMDFKQKFGAQAQMSLVDITQRGTHPMKSLAGRILAQLNVLPDQSSYF